MNTSDTAYLPVCVACLKGQLLIISGPDSEVHPEFMCERPIGCAKMDEGEEKEGLVLPTGPGSGLYL